MTLASTRSEDPAKVDLHSADRKALERMHAVRPVWRGATLARDGGIYLPALDLFCAAMAALN